MSIEKRATRALKWAGSFKLLGQLFTWAITIVVIRLLAPADYGLLALSMVVISLSTIMAEMGMGAALIQSKKLDSQELSRVAGLVWSLNLGIGLLVLLSAPVFAWVFDEDRLTNIIRVAALQFPLMALISVPQALAARELDFRKLSLIELASAVTSSLTTLALAWWGFGVWSLVVGNLAGLLIRGLAMNWFSRWVRIRFSLVGMRKHLRFGAQTTATYLIWQFASQADVIIGGRLLTRDALGTYSIAYHLATLPMQKIMSIINQVAFPALSRMQEDLPRLHKRLLLALSLLTAISVPLLWGISSVANELVPLLLGPHWQLAVLPLQIITLVVPVRMISALLNTTVTALGHSGISLRNTINTAIIWPSGFLFGAQWGSNGLAYSWLIIVPITFMVNFPSTRRAIGIGWRDLARSIRVPLIAGLLMFAAILGVRPALMQFDPLLRLIVLMAVGVLIYSGSIGLFGRGVIRDLKSLIATMRSR